MSNVNEKMVNTEAMDQVNDQVIEEAVVAKESLVTKVWNGVKTHKKLLIGLGVGAVTVAGVVALIKYGSDDEVVAMIVDEAVDTVENVTEAVAE